MLIIFRDRTRRKILVFFMFSSERIFVEHEETFQLIWSGGHIRLCSCTAEIRFRSSVRSTHAIGNFEISGHDRILGMEVVSMNSEIGLQEVWRRFKDFQHVFLATVEDDQPRVRPVTLISFEKRLWITTDTNSRKINQIQRNPKVEFSFIFKEGNKDCCLRVAGLARTIKEKELKAKMANHVDFFNKHWESVDDPSYTLVEIRPSEVTYVSPGKTKHMKM